MLEEKEVADDVSDEHSSHSEEIIDNGAEVGKNVTVEAFNELKVEVIALKEVVLEIRSLVSCLGNP